MFARVARLLVEGSLTVIHGEYYPDNVLVRETVVHPVDWQTAAVAAGEIDLAALTERWPRGVAEQCENAYRRARWGDRTPASFHETLLAARLYLHFRWPGDRRRRGGVGPAHTGSKARKHRRTNRSLLPSTGGD